LYRGLLRIPVKHFFTVTNFFILLLAAGLAAQAAGFLNQAGLVPSLGNEVWDTSRLLNQTSIAGQLLHILVGYTARPMGIQILFYLSTMLILLLLMRLARLSRKKA
ncbi:MAG TPA: FTR1 family protein, partial [Burkholderiales bacterium]|nr:FTR1 family protein [Burkholderiales bacterium]